jgi:hypothetical protein
VATAGSAKRSKRNPTRPPARPFARPFARPLATLDWDVDFDFFDFDLDFNFFERLVFFGLFKLALGLVFGLVFKLAFVLGLVLGNWGELDFASFNAFNFIFIMFFVFELTRVLNECTRDDKK